MRATLPARSSGRATRPAVPLLGAMLVACAPADPRSVVPGPDRASLVRIVTWNVHDLFDEEDAVSPPGDLDTVPTPGEVEAKLDRVATVLRRLDADVALLQEVENLPLLGRLAIRAGYPEVRLLEGNDPRGIDVGLLSWLPVRSYTSHADELGGDGRRLWPRDAVEAELEAGGGTLLLLGTHLSSRLSDPEGRRRGEQAARLRELADRASARRPGALVLVGGDLNDSAGASSLAPLLGDGAWRDVLAEAPLAETLTWPAASAREALDHLAARPLDGARVVAAWVEGGADVARASDHRPLVVDLAAP